MSYSNSLSTTLSRLRSKISGLGHQKPKERRGGSPGRSGGPANMGRETAVFRVYSILVNKANDRNKPQENQTKLTRVTVKR